MRPRSDYVALVQIPVNGVRGYNVGDDVPASAVENLSLVVGVQVAPTHTGVIARPAGNATRAEWELYAIGQGMSAADAGELTREELRARYPEPTDGVPDVVPNPLPDVVAEQAAEQVAGHPAPSVDAVEVDPPGANARKADWVEYAVARGMSRETAEDSTIAQLADYDYALLADPQRQ